MTQIESPIPDLNWLTATEDTDESWLGPGPKLCNLRPWIDALASHGKYTLVAATYAAAKAASHYWDAWLAADQQIAMESILDGDTPTKQLAAVKCWLAAPTDSNKAAAFDTVDHTKQLHWFHEEYSDVWFDEPGMWAVESSEFSVLTITGDPYSSDSLESHATLSILCAINAFRKRDDADLRTAISYCHDCNSTSTGTRGITNKCTRVAKSGVLTMENLSSRPG